MNNRAKEPNPGQSALWSRKRGKSLTGARRVVIAHADKPLADALGLLFGLKGYPAQPAMDVSSLRRAIDDWQPQAIFLDTRIGGTGNYGLVRDLREPGQSAAPDRLILAMSSFLPEEPVAALQAAGYDGHCRRPCAVWRMMDLLDEFYADTHAS
jgi:CheY-like chemotaxis protein